MTLWRAWTTRKSAARAGTRVERHVGPIDSPLRVGEGLRTEQLSPIPDRLQRGLVAGGARAADHLEVDQVRLLLAQRLEDRGFGGWVRQVLQAPGNHRDPVAEIDRLLLVQFPHRSRRTLAGSPQVELKGRIEKIQVAQGQGMPCLEVRSAGKTTRVILGSVRYLMEQDFNPKAGDDVVVKGYKVNDDVVAIRVALPARGKVLKLRDADGRPVWRKGRYAGPMRKPSK